MPNMPHWVRLCSWVELARVWVAFSVLGIRGLLITMGDRCHVGVVSGCLEQTCLDPPKTTGRFSMEQVQGAPEQSRQGPRCPITKRRRRPRRYLLGGSAPTFTQNRCAAVRLPRAARGLAHTPVRTAHDRRSLGRHDGWWVSRWANVLAGSGRRANRRLALV